MGTSGPLQSSEAVSSLPLQQRGAPSSVKQPFLFLESYKWRPKSVPTLRQGPGCSFLLGKPPRALPLGSASSTGLEGVLLSHCLEPNTPFLCVPGQ